LLSAVPASRRFNRDSSNSLGPLWRGGQWGKLAVGGAHASLLPKSVPPRPIPPCGRWTKES